MNYLNGWTDYCRTLREPFFRSRNLKRLPGEDFMPGRRRTVESHRVWIASMPPLRCIMESCWQRATKVTTLEPESKPSTLGRKNKSRGISCFNWVVKRTTRDIL